MRAAWAVLHSLRDPRDNYVIYNCGTASGCSRKHKHLQAAKRPGTETETGETSIKLFPDVSGETEVKVPYKYFLHRFAEPEMGHGIADHVFEIYKQFLTECKALPGSTECPPHNLILTSDWLLMIPRRFPLHEAYMDLLPGGAGMMGMVSSPSQVVLDRWVSEGPAKLLSAFGLAPDS